MIAVVAPIVEETTCRGLGFAAVSELYDVAQSGYKRALGPTSSSPAQALLGFGLGFYFCGGTRFVNFLLLPLPRTPFTSLGVLGEGETEWATASDIWSSACRLMLAKVSQAWW